MPVSAFVLCNCCFYTFGKLLSCPLFFELLALLPDFVFDDASASILGGLKLFSQLETLKMLIKPFFTAAL